MVTSPDTPRYVFRNESIVPFSLYEVKVGVYNNKGEGPFSPVTTVFSAEEGMENILIIYQFQPNKPLMLQKLIWKFFVTSDKFLLKDNN